MGFFRVTLRKCASAALLVSVLGCRNTGAGSADVPAPSLEQFQKSVYPMLLRNCAFSTCHGDERRFFQIYGPGRTRLDPKSMPNDPATMLEIQHSYDRARSMLLIGQDARNSLLLRKPLEASQGGQGHKGVDASGRNVFSAKTDPEYMLLEQWATSIPPAPAASTGRRP